MEVEPVFEAHEIDLEYEFEAARYFDLTREETPVEAWEAENWFESAKSYPPSRESFAKFFFIISALETKFLNFFCYRLIHFVFS